jgi:serine phosphatase RsbU (regulator of sigma subunit)
MDSDPLGIFSALVLQRKDIKVAKGARFFLYTDGMIESVPGASRKKGVESLVESCVRHQWDSLSEAVSMIALDQTRAKTVEDDLLLLAVEVTD